MDNKKRKKIVEALESSTNEDFLGFSPSDDGSCVCVGIVNILKDIKKSLDTKLEEKEAAMKNDLDEIKLHLREIDSKINSFIEQEENIDVHQILSSLPYTSILDVPKVNKYFGIETVFSKMVSRCVIYYQSLDLVECFGNIF